LLVALFGFSITHAAFFGCSAHPATNTTVTSGNATIACYSGLYDGISTLSCAFTWKSLTSNVMLAHLHVGTDATIGGPVTFDFNPGTLSGVAGQWYHTINATFPVGAAGGFHPINGATFDSQITLCASGTGCYFNLHTANYGGGEMRCEVQPMSNLVYDFTVPLLPTPAGTNTGNNNAASAGIATVRMGAVGNSGLHAWGYHVGFSVGSPVMSSHIHQGASIGDNTGPIKVYFDQGQQRTTGEFIGVALEGTTYSSTTFPSAWPLYTADFDTAMTSHFNYINVHTTANTGGEIRAQISPSSASQTSLAILAVVFMIASWMSL